ncbi:BTB/POZ domain containing protein [Histomonas meleagridis]|uniref:BTB/POZ domain containing protein n=1 Tax=Histomonas meleagridis TaxID=135588 RepID=UPI00355AC214|nr:BTB/POZ domain containing protein [Histomonas meleagridis]KAH0806495.1 BTB/POZ domain containing protein [Histomonas meleagridis]
MKEASTCIVSAKVNPENLLPKVISWMYDGKLSFNFEQVVPLLAISRCYVIPKLTSELHKFLNNNLNSSNILKLVKKCYDLELPSELEALESYLTKYLLEIPIEDLSDELDVFVFARTVKKATMPTDIKVKLVSKFLGEYETNQNEKEALASIFDPSEKGLKQILVENHVDWLPETFLRSLR